MFPLDFCYFEFVLFQLFCCCWTVKHGVLFFGRNLYYYCVNYRQNIALIIDKIKTTNCVIMGWLQLIMIKAHTFTITSHQFCEVEMQSTTFLILSYVEYIIAPNQHLSKLSLILSTNDFFRLSELNKIMATSKFMYSSFDWRIPRSYQPHFSCTLTSFPWRSCRKGSGFYIWS